MCPSALAIDPLREQAHHLADVASGEGVLACTLQEKRIPASLHFKTPNELIDFDKCRISVVTATLELAEVAPGESAVTGASGFGFGGTNAHVVFQEVDKETLQRSQQALLYKVGGLISAEAIY